MFLLLHLWIPLVLAHSILSATHALTIRDTDPDISNIKGGILVKNGKQTSCELGVIDSTAAFVSAPCLDFINDAVGKNTTYEVYLDAGINNKSVKYSVESVTVHPGYDSTTLINPIAILQFNKESIETWSNPIAIDRNNSWGNVQFVRRGLTNMDTLEWKQKVSVITGYDDATLCSFYANYNSNLIKSMDILYSHNQNDLLCSNATTYPPYAYLSGCAVPYGSVEVYIANKLYVAGTFINTILSADIYSCTLFALQTSNYVLFADYIAFASQVLGRHIGYYPNTNGIAPQSNPNYSMIQTKLWGKFVYKDGDFYANQTEKSQNDNIPTVTDNNTNQVQSHSSIEADDATSTTAGYSENYIFSSIEIVSETLSDSSAGDNGIHSKNSGLSLKSKTIIGVVCGIIGGMLLTGILIVIYLRWKRAHRNIYRNHKTGSNIHSLLIMDPASTRTSFSFRLPPTPVYKPHKPHIKINTAARSPLSARTPSIYTGSNGSSILNYFKLPLYKTKTPSTPDRKQ